MASLFEHHIKDAGCHFKYAKGAPSVEGKEFHSYHEIVLFIDGESRLISTNIQLPLKKNSLVIIPKEQFHQFIVTNPEKYVRCILGFENTEDFAAVTREVMNEVAVITTPPSGICRLFDSLIRVATSTLSTKEKTQFLHACVHQIVLELKLFSGEHINRYMLLSSVTQQALSYIDQNFSKDIHLDDIAKAINTSPSSLSHKFKADLNISVYRYLSEKRLSAARQWIVQGETAAQAALLCGFKEYSCFFRLYKKHYNAKPSESRCET